jgi:hypothetical protein
MSWRIPLLAVAVSLALAPAAAGGELRTNWQRALVRPSEVRPGGPQPDGIPAIDRPRFVSPAAADAWLAPAEPVLSLQIAGDSRAYPLQILIWHEIVNDVVGGAPVAVTYCPLCNTGIVFDRRLDGHTLDFGTSGLLYKSDLVMYDRQTHSLWAQVEGRAIAGDLAGKRLTWIPANTVAYADWKAARPGGRVLSRETGHERDYGANPYQAYDEPDRHPFLFDGVLDPRLPPKERVVGVVIGDHARAYPFSLLAERGVLEDILAGNRLVVFYRPGALSALDHARIARSRAVGATGVFEPTAGGRSLTFRAIPGGFRDRETGSTWNILGHAVAGPLAGRRLRPIVHVDGFWFAWAAFHPGTTVHRATPAPAGP